MHHVQRHRTAPVCDAGRLKSQWSLQYKVKSPDDKRALAEAKVHTRSTFMILDRGAARSLESSLAARPRLQDAIHLELWEGIMLRGEYAGQTLSAARPRVKQQLLERGEALKYYEPDTPVLPLCDSDGDVCGQGCLVRWRRMRGVYLRAMVSRLRPAGVEGPGHGVCHTAPVPRARGPQGSRGGH